MRVLCNATSGSALTRHVLDVGYTIESRFNVSVGKEYTVFGMAQWQSILLLLLSDDTDLPNWYPLEIFSVSDARIPSEWFFAAPGNESGLQAIWGYESLVCDESHYDGLLERDPKALEVFELEKRQRAALDECGK